MRIAGRTVVLTVPLLRPRAAWPPTVRSGSGVLNLLDIVTRSAGTTALLPLFAVAHRMSQPLFAVPRERREGVCGVGHAAW